jgi:hypothetical protein
MTSHPGAETTHRRPLIMRVWGNPLARGVDRAEAAIVLALILVWLLSLPLIATVGSVEWTRIDAQLAAQRVTDVPVDAVISGEATLASAGRDGIAIEVTAPAVWTGRDGRPAGGQIQVPAYPRVGQHTTVWLDPAGQVVAQPMDSATAAFLTVLTVAAAWVLFGAMLTALWWLLRRRLDRTRWEVWDLEWAEFTDGHRST